jgi:rhodanese-related sulfurtransferase
MIQQVDPSSFENWRQSAAAGAPGTLPILLDVREPWELQTASVKPAGFTVLAIPMREVPARLAELRDAHGENQPIACLCHHGMRSLQVANYLAQAGFTEVVNVSGGIDAWAKQLDPGMPKY